ncbi:MAG: O-antigen ligase family protein [Planctomycetota bacterium]
MGGGLRFLALNAALLALGLKDALWAFIAIAFTYNFDATMWWWGSAIPTVSYSYWITVFALGCTVLHLRKYDAPAVFKDPALLLVALMVLFEALHFNPVDPVKHAQFLDRDTKSLLKMFVLALTIRSPGRIRLFVWVLLIGAGGLGLEAWRNPRRESGRLYGIGTRDAQVDNTFGAHLALMVPLLIHFMVRGRKWERILAVVMGAFVLNGIILTSSRGAFLATAVGAGLYIIGSMGERKTRKRALYIALAGCVAFLFLIDQVLLDRLATLIGGETEAFGEEKRITGSGRTIIWAAGWEMVKDHPFGLGGGGFRALSLPYLQSLEGIDPDAVSMSESRAPHNTFLEVATETGVHALLCYLGVLMIACRRLWRERKWARFELKNETWSGMVLAIGCTFASLMVASVFGSRFHYEMFFWLVAMASAVPAASRFLGRCSESPDGEAARMLDDDYLTGIEIRKVIFVFAGSLILLV